jgi:hypothetical protein
MTKEGQQNIVNLVRCAWAGSQKYGALVWSGDIASSWSTLRDQLAAGLNMVAPLYPMGFSSSEPRDRSDGTSMRLVQVKVSSQRTSECHVHTTNM